MRERIEPRLFVGLVGQSFRCVFRPIMRGLGEAKWTGYGVAGLVGVRITATNFYEETLLVRSLALVWTF